VDHIIIKKLRIRGKKVQILFGEKLLLKG